MGRTENKTQRAKDSQLEDRKLNAGAPETIQDLFDKEGFSHFLDQFGDYEKLNTKGESEADNEIILQRYEMFQRIPEIAKQLKQAIREKFPKIFKFKADENELNSLEAWLSQEVTGGNTEILDEMSKQLETLHTGRAEIEVAEAEFKATLESLGGAGMSLEQVRNKLRKEDAQAREDIREAEKAVAEGERKKADKVRISKGRNLAKETERGIDTIIGRHEQARQEIMTKACQEGLNRLLANQKLLEDRFGEKLPNRAKAVGERLRDFAAAFEELSKNGKSKKLESLNDAAEVLNNLHSEQKNYADEILHKFNGKKRREYGATLFQVANQQQSLEEQTLWHETQQLEEDLELLKATKEAASGLVETPWSTKLADTIENDLKSKLHYIYRDIMPELLSNTDLIKRNSKVISSSDEELEQLDSMAGARPILVAQRIMQKFSLSRAKRKVTGGSSLSTLGIHVTGTKEKIKTLEEANEAKQKVRDAYQEAQMYVFDRFQNVKDIFEKAREKRDKRFEKLLDENVSLRDTLAEDKYFQKIERVFGEAESEGDTETDNTNGETGEVADQDSDDIDLIAKKDEVLVGGFTWNQFKEQRVLALTRKWALEIGKIANGFADPAKIKRSSIVSKIHTMEKELGPKAKDPRYKKIKFDAMERAVQDPTINRVARKLLENILGEMERKAKTEGLPDGKEAFAIG